MSLPAVIKTRGPKRRCGNNNGKTTDDGLRAMPPGPHTTSTHAHITIIAIFELAWRSGHSEYPLLLQNKYRLAVVLCAACAGCQATANIYDSAAHHNVRGAHRFRADFARINIKNIVTDAATANLARPNATRSGGARGTGPRLPRRPMPATPAPTVFVLLRRRLASHNGEGGGGARTTTIACLFAA